MPPKIGYLLPTREQIMESRYDTASLLALADRAQALGYASIWVGDSVLARPRHDPLTLLAAVAARVPRVALRNPVLLGHQVATLDQVSEGRFILGVGIARDVPNIRAEFAACGVPFERRVGRMMEGLRLCRALWRGEPVDWDGRWPVQGGVLAPLPYRPGGPPIWIGGNSPASLQRVGKWFDGWFPNAPEPAAFASHLGDIQATARSVGRDPAQLSAAMYLTLSIDEDAARANARMDAFLEGYYGAPAEILRRRQAVYSGPGDGAVRWLDGYAKAGATDLILRFAGDHVRHLEMLAKITRTLAR